MDAKTISEIISDWKTHSLPEKGYPNYADRSAYILALFEEIHKHGFTRSEASNFSVFSKILDRFVSKTAKPDIKKSIIAKTTEQIERSISIVYGSFGKQTKESAKAVLKEEQLTLPKKEDIIESESLPSPKPAKQRTVRYLSEEKRTEMLKQFKFRTGHDEDLE